MQLVELHREMPRRGRRSRAPTPALAMPMSLGLCLTMQAVEGPLGSTPLSLFGANLQGWFDSGDRSTEFIENTGGPPPGTTPTGDTQTVGTFREKSSYGRHTTQAVGTQRPMLDASVSPSVLAPDGGDRLFSATFTAVPQPLNFAFLSDNLANSSTFFDCGAAGTRLMVQRSASATSIVVFAGSSVTVSGVPDLGTRQLLLIEFNGASTRVWAFNGTAFVQIGGSINPGTNTLADFKLFGNSANFLLAARFSELFAWSGALTAQNRTDVGSYFKVKWGL